MRSTLISHSVTMAAIAPITTRGAAKTAPMTPTVTGMTKMVLPLLSLTVILLTLPSLMSSLIFLVTCLPLSL